MGKKLKNNKFTLIFIATFLIIGVLSGCSTASKDENKESPVVSKKAGFNNITPEAAKKRLDSEKNIILLDVRTKEEYDSGHIKDSILIPVDNLKEEAKNKLKDKDATIFVYCRSGNRSTAAAKILVELGYKNIYNLGGINSWPYEVIR